MHVEQTPVPKVWESSGLLLPQPGLPLLRQTQGLLHSGLCLNVCSSERPFLAT